MFIHYKKKKKLINVGKPTTVIFKAIFLIKSQGLKYIDFKICWVPKYNNL